MSTETNSMNQKHGVFPEPGTIRFERLLPGPPERIWDYLTQSELKARWLAAGNVEPRVGGSVELRFRHSDLSEADDPIPEKYKNMETEGEPSYDRVTVWQPYKKLSYTWTEGPDEESLVTFELFPQKDNQVLLVLTHERLGEDPEKLLSVSSGWHTHLQILVDRLEEREPRGFWSMHTENDKMYERLIKTV